MRGKRICILILGAALLLVSFDGRKEQPDYKSHAVQEEILPPAAGNSYYESQWALRNDGRLQRITSVCLDGQAGEENGPGESGPAAGRGWDSWEKITDSVEGVDIRAEAAWQVYEQTAGRRPVTVAVIDTGVDISHEELAGSLWVNQDEIPGDGIDNDNNGYIDDINGWNFYSGNSQVYTGPEDDHGTHGAGIIAAAWDGQGVTGIADSGYVKLMILKVLGSQEGTGVASNVKLAIRYAQDNGADICNLSIGSLVYDEEMRALIRNSHMLFVVSAGNGDAGGTGGDIDKVPMYPASFPEENIIAAGNLMFDGTLDESSNYGPVSVDIAAPGTHILSSIPGGYAFMTGTSMAAPMVTGTAALVYSCRTDLSLMEVREAIINSARPMEGLEGKVASGGMLDAYGAITYRP